VVDRDSERESAGKGMVDEELRPTPRWSRLEAIVKCGPRSRCRSGEVLPSVAMAHRGDDGVTNR
jgi:hypothetical protein